MPAVEGAGAPVAELSYTVNLALVARSGSRGHFPAAKCRCDGTLLSCDGGQFRGLLQGQCELGIERTLAVGSFSVWAGAWWTEEAPPRSRVGSQVSFLGCK